MLARAALLTASLLLGCAAPRPAPPAAAALQLPDLQLVQLDGQPSSLLQVVKGKVALISLWATWCAPCLEEFPALLRFSERARQQGVLGIAVAIGEPHQHVAAFVKERSLLAPALLHLVDEQFRFADALGQRRVPTTLVIAPSGRIAFTGAAFDEEALDAVRALLSNQDPNSSRKGDVHDVHH